MQVCAFCDSATELWDCAVSSRIPDVADIRLKNLCSVLSSSALFINGQAATSIRQSLKELGYQQLATPMFCDNSCAVGIANKSFTQKRSKTIDMRYHWIQDQVVLDNFTVTWENW